MKLISSFYQIAIDPLHFDAMLKEWDRAIRRSIITEENFDGTEVAEHSERAAAIIRQIESTESPSTRPALCEVIEQDPNPALLLSAHGQILAVNASAEKELDVSAGAFLSDLNCVSPGSIGKLRGLTDALGRDKGGPHNAHHIVGLLEMATRGDGGKVLFAVSRADCSADEKVAALLTSLAPVWGTETLSILQTHFDLTPAEIEVIRLLAGGQNVSQIANTRRTTLHTTRTQIRSILLKMDLQTQIDLVRQLGFLQRFSAPPGSTQLPGAGATYQPPTPEQRFLRLANGNRLSFVEFGPPDGKPVLFLHGLIDDTAFAPEFTDLCHERGIRLVAPARPCFGDSDPYRDPSAALEEFAGYAIELLDHLGIATTAVIGHMAGTLYAVALAEAHPTRVNAILSVAGAIPMIANWQFTKMSMGHRIAGLTARQAPVVLPLLVRAGIRLIRRGQESRLLDLLFRDAPRDREHARQLGLAKRFYKKFHFVTQQGHRAFLTDIRLVSADWSARVDKVTCPMTLLHGEHDGVVLIEGVREFATRHPHFPLHVSPLSGQLILFNEPQLVFDLLLQTVDA